MFTAIISRMGYRSLGARGLVAVVAVVVVILGVYGRGWDANKARATEATTLRGEPVFVRAEQQRQAAADRAMVMAEQAREREDSLAHPTYGTYSAELAARDLAMVMEEQQRERELILMEAAGLVTLTTTTTDLSDVVVAGLGPFRRFGVNPERVGLLIALSIRAVPVVLGLAEQIRDAQRARGKTLSPRAFAVPLLVRALRHAQRMGDALVARGVDD